MLDVSVLDQFGRPVAGVNIEVDAVAPSSVLTFLSNIPTRQGNAAVPAWLSDSRTVVMADEESSSMSGIRIDTSVSPFGFTHANLLPFAWATEVLRGTGDAVFFRSSVGGAVTRVDPSSWAPMWSALAKPGPGHSLASLGVCLYAPVETNPAKIIVLTIADGSVAASVTVASLDWTGTSYGAYADAVTNRLYVAAGGTSGGLFIFDLAMPLAPALLGSIAGASSDFAVRGNRLYRVTGNVVETWDVTNPAAPVLLASYTQPTYKPAGGGGTIAKYTYATRPSALSPDGTRLYCAYHSVVASTGAPFGNAFAGYQIFDVTGTAPVSVIDVSGPFLEDNGLLWMKPTTLALSPDGSRLAVTAWAFGAMVFDAATNALLGDVATTGEGHDVYLDPAGEHAYIFANDDLQIYQTSDGSLVDVQFPTDTDGDWLALPTGDLLLPGRGKAGAVARVENGWIAFPQKFDQGAMQYAFDGAYLYAATTKGVTIRAMSWTGTPPVYTFGPVLATLQSTLQFCAVAVDPQAKTLWAMTNATSPSGAAGGLYVWDVSNPTAPVQVAQDPFTFNGNGEAGKIARIVYLNGRAYVGATDAYLRIYQQAAPFARTAVLQQYRPNYLDVLLGRYLLVASYWYTPAPGDGLYVLDTTTPDAPAQVQAFPWGANFRCRAFPSLGIVARIGLFGTDLFKVAA